MARKAPFLEGGLVLCCALALVAATAIAGPSLGGGPDQAAVAKKKCKKGKKCKKKKAQPPAPPVAPPDDVAPSPPADTTPPNTEILTGPDGPTNDNTPSFTYTTEPVEATATFECGLDGTFESCDAAGKTFTTTVSDGEHTFQVRAIDQAGNADPSPATRMFTVDTTPPDVTVTSPATDGTLTNDTTPTFSFSSTESASFRCQIDSDSPTDCTSPFTPTTPLSDASHTLTVIAVDAAGNLDPSPATRTFTVDATPPDVTITSPASDGTVTNDTTPTFSFSSTESASFRCQIDGGSPVSCTSPFTPTSPVSHGSHALTVTATDSAGNSDPTPATRTFTVDSTPPDAMITSPASDGTTTPDNTPSFTFASNEPASFRCKLDGGSPADCTSPFTPTTPLSDGSHTLTVFATDAAGNSDPIPAMRTLTVDTTPPTVTITSPASDGTTTSDNTPSFTFTTSGASDVRCRIDAGTSVSCSSPFTPTTPLSDGSHTLTVTATDAVGNGNSASRTLTVDTAGPMVTIDSGPANGERSGSNDPQFSFSSTASDFSHFQCSLDGSPFLTCTSPRSFTDLLDGSHAFQVRGVDTLGNAGAPVTRTWTIDTVAPTTTIVGGPPNGTQLRNTNSVGYGFNSNEAGSTFQCKLASLEADFSSCPSGKTYTNLPDGNYTFSVFATDTAGNSDATPDTRTFSIFLDQDNDGFSAQSTDPNLRDCNDASSAVRPGATDNTVNGVDENCNGVDGS